MSAVNKIAVKRFMYDYSSYAYKHDPALCGAVPKKGIKNLRYIIAFCHRKGKNRFAFSPILRYLHKSKNRKCAKSRILSKKIHILHKNESKTPKKGVACPFFGVKMLLG